MWHSSSSPVTNEVTFVTDCWIQNFKADYIALQVLAFFMQQKFVTKNEIGKTPLLLNVDIKDVDRECIKTVEGVSYEMNVFVSTH